MALSEMYTGSPGKLQLRHGETASPRNVTVKDLERGQLAQIDAHLVGRGEPRVPSNVLQS